LLALWPAAASAAPSKPNIVYILCDDLGYGDIRCLNPQRGKIATPHLDRLAGQGMAFTDAHSGSAVCTPTRYGILTGRYAWRTSLQRGVLGGVSPPLIAQHRLTVAGLLKTHGYHTACIGKWHLGLGWTQWENPAGRDQHPGWQFDFSQPFVHGPLSLGFDSFFGISASLDMAPFAFIENDRLTELPTAVKTWVRKGPAAPGFEAIDVLPALTRRAVATIGQHAADAKQGKPFFLYLPLASPHTPIVPTAEWQGKSALGPYADFVMQTDSCVGEVLAALEQHGVADNTLVIFTSDNGCSPAANTEGLEKQGHFPSAGFRGYKSDIWDGGHHIPLLARWPGVTKPGSRCDRIVCLTDLMATCADLLETKLPADAGEDSFSILPLLKGGDKAERKSVVHHSINGTFALREQQWKIVFGAGSGGWSKGGGQEPVQLYAMSEDPGEKTNLQAEHPDEVERLTGAMKKIIADGRSTPGNPLKNDVEVVLRKAAKPKPKPAKAAAKAK
jgi:arylsulfatase A-like enzyme